MKNAIQNVILNGSGTNQEKALVWAILAIPVIICLIAFGGNLR